MTFLKDLSGTIQQTACYHHPTKKNWHFYHLLFNYILMISDNTCRGLFTRFSVILLSFWLRRLETIETNLLTRQLYSWISRFDDVEVDGRQSYHLRAPINRFTYHNKTREIYRFSPTHFSNEIEKLLTREKCENNVRQCERLRS